jgi:hypothetical protein
LQPERVRRHRERRVFAQQRHERVDVVALEGADVTIEECRLAVVQHHVGHTRVARGHRRPRALQAAVHRRHRHLQALRHFRRRPAEDLGEKEHCALPRRQVL